MRKTTAKKTTTKTSKKIDEPVQVSEASAEPVVTTVKPIKVPREKGEERNGIRRPRDGGKCASVWEAMEARHASTGTVPTTADAKAWALETGANVSNATQELAAWKRWAGLTKPRAT